MNKIACSSCKFLGNQKLGGYECRRYPPVDTWIQYNQFPTTQLNQSCGEWVAKQVEGEAR